jgi:short-subunit dehydrogenase
LKAVMLGATRGMGRAVARILARRGERLFLLGRDPLELARSARDLEVLGAVAPVGSAPCDLLHTDSFAGALQQADEALEGFDTVIVTAGLFDTQERLEQELDRAAALLHADFTATVIFCEQARQRLLARGGGTLCVFSSVAGDRARQSVVLYGSAKAGLSYYLEGLDLRFRRFGVRTICVKPGFVRTGMTQGLKPPPFSAEPEPVAARVVRAIDLGWHEVYAPGIWRLILLAVRALPRAVMARVRF